MCIISTHIKIIISVIVLLSFLQWNETYFSICDVLFEVNEKIKMYTQIEDAIYAIGKKAT